MRTPSLYNHVESLDDVRRRVALLALRDLADALRDAAVGRAGDDALAAMADAYRAYARAPSRPLRRDPARAGRAATRRCARRRRARSTSCSPILRGYGLEGDDAIHAARAVRSALHGFVALEAGGGFGIPVDLDESYARMVARARAAGSRDAPVTWP